MARLAIKMTKEDLILGARRYAEIVVRRMITTMHLPEEMSEELVAAANLGLVEAAQNFDHERGSDFKSYAFLRIRGAVIDYLTQTSSLSKNSYWYAKALEAMNEVRLIDDEPAVAAIKLPQSTEEALARVFDFAADGALAFRLSYDEVEIEATESAKEVLNPEEKLAIKQKFKNLKSIVESLPDKERFIVEQYYYHDKSFVEIASMLEGHTKSWVSRLHSRALDLIKKRYLDEMAVETSAV